jgi:hypothetical protein
MELIENIAAYIQTDYILNKKVCNTSCLKIVDESIPMDICEDYCIIKIYVSHFMSLIKVYFLYKMIKNLVRNESIIALFFYASVIFFII